MEHAVSGYPAGRGGVGYHALRQSKLIWRENLAIMMFG